MSTPANPVPTQLRPGAAGVLRKTRGRAAWVLTLAAGASLLAACGGAPQPQQPALAVLIVVDQLRADLLDRYDALFTGGLRRLRDEAASS